MERNEDISDPLVLSAVTESVEGLSADELIAYAESEDGKQALAGATDSAMTAACSARRSSSSASLIPSGCRPKANSPKKQKAVQHPISMRQRNSCWHNHGRTRAGRYVFTYRTVIRIDSNGEPFLWGSGTWVIPDPKA